MTAPTRDDIARVARHGPFSPEWSSLQGATVPNWYIDGKFGIFVHWGVYSVPAFGNEWYPRQMYLPGTREYRHHRQTYGTQEAFGYKDFIPQFTGQGFDADAWVTLFRRAGARFVVPVAEHHDGFAMYDTSLSEWSAARMGPKRDVIAELAAAARRHGLVFGVSSHRAEHWWFYEGGWQAPSDVQEPGYAGLYGPAHPKTMPPDETFLDDWLRRCCEIVDRCQPQLFWFDWWIEEAPFAPYLREFAAYYYNRAREWSREVTINHKFGAFPEGAAVFDIERGQLDDLRTRFWQTDTSISRNSWGFISDHNYRDARTILHDLIDITSKNGALLLNVGPRADGTIPEAEASILRQIGDWLAVNGEAIYGTRPWKVFGEGPTDVVSGSFNDDKRTSFTSNDVRYVTRGDTLYAIVLGLPPSGVVTLRSLGTHLSLHRKPVLDVSIVGVPRGATLVPTWERDGEALRVTLPESTRATLGPAADDAVALKLL